MTKIFATGFDDITDDDRPHIVVTEGAGNRSGEPEVHLTFVDPADPSSCEGYSEVQAWFSRDELLAAILGGPGPETPRPIRLTEPAEDAAA